jgi:beta-fructofuranosidase
MNDPNGLIQWRGKYHLFYQHNPYAATWGLMHWGHAVSEDLVHWRHLPMALTPTSDSPDQDGCWSGCAVNDHGTATLIYTGIREGHQRPCLATSRDDDLLTWEKYAGNPVIAAPPAELELVGFRDHSVWQEGDTWYQLIGSGIQGVGGTALLYRSPDLRHWEYLGPLCIGHREETGEMWECPDFFTLGEKHVLIISPIPLRKALYWTGIYADYRFTPEIQGVVDFGGHFYAPQTFCDDGGRRILFGWLWEGRDHEACQKAGWAGVMSLPRVLSLHPDGQLSQTPAPEVRGLRGRHWHFEKLEVSSSLTDLLREIQGDSLEILAEFEPGDAIEFGIQVRRSPDGAEQTEIVYDRLERRLTVDRERSSLDPSTYREPFAAPLKPAVDEKLTLHVFLDRSVVEVFANDQICLTSRIYPARADSLGLDLFARDGSVPLRSLDIWEMHSISS